MKTVDEARQRFEKLAEEYKEYRNTKRLINLLRSRTEDRLLNSKADEDPEIGVYIALLNALYRLEQFENMLREEKPDVQVMMEILTWYKSLKQNPALFSSNQNPTNDEC